MKLLIQGSIVDRGNHASFSNTHDDLPALSGKRFALAVSDAAAEIEEIRPYSIRLALYRGSEVDRIHLGVGDSIEFHHEGNAYVYTLKFLLTE